MRTEILKSGVYRPRQPTPGELRKAGVEMIDASGFGLRCLKCGGMWAPGMLRGGRLPRHYWRCPHGRCN